MNTQQNISKAIFSVNAIVFGTDASILGVKLYDGFSFVRKSLMPLKDHLDEVFETDAMGLRREYELARFDDSLDVICITKNIELDSVDVFLLENTVSNGFPYDIKNRLHGECQIIAMEPVHVLADHII